MKWITTASLVAMLMVFVGAMGSTPAAATSRVLARGSFGAGEEIGVSGSGSTTILQQGGEIRVNLNDDFAVSSGPKLTVWLSPDSKTWTQDSVKLGALERESGKSVFIVDSETDLRAFASIVIWSEEQSVLFSPATLRWEDKSVLIAQGEFESEAGTTVSGTVGVVEQGDNVWVDLVALEIDFDQSLDVWLSSAIDELSTDAVLLGERKHKTDNESFIVDDDASAESLPDIVLLWDTDAERTIAWSQLEPVDNVTTDFEARVVATGSFGAGEEAYFGSGSMQIVEVAEGSFVVILLDDFSVTPGPALVVMLSPSPTYYADGAITLGGLVATAGAQEYALPAGIDPTTYGSVIIWCAEFSVLFSAAPLG